MDLKSYMMIEGNLSNEFNKSDDSKEWNVFELNEMKVRWPCE